MPSGVHSVSSDQAALGYNPSSDSHHYYSNMKGKGFNPYFSSKIKGKGFNPYSAMEWLTDGCPGKRTSEQKQHLYQVRFLLSTGTPSDQNTPEDLCTPKTRGTSASCTPKTRGTSAFGCVARDCFNLPLK